jgi:hypothetical protein
MTKRVVDGLTRRRLLAGLGAAGGLAGSAMLRGQGIMPGFLQPPSLPLNGLIARYESSNAPGAQGLAVPAWSDNSGSGFVTSQATTLQQPSVNLAANTISGRRSVYFVGAGNVLGTANDLILPSGLSVSTQSCSVVVIREQTLIGSSNYLINLGSNALYLNSNASVLTAGPSNRSAASPLYCPFGVPQMLGFASGSSNFKFILGGVLSAAVGSPITSATATGGTLGCFGTNQFNDAGNYYLVLIYNRQLTQADVTQIYAYARAVYRVFPVSSYMRLATCGDSHTSGYAGSIDNGQAWVYQLLRANPSWTCYNTAITGKTTAQLVSPDFGYSSTPTKKICVTWCGTNDLIATGQASTALSNLAAWVTARRATGWKCVGVTLLPRNGGISANPNPGGYEADRQTVNTALRANSGGIYGDAIADPGNDATIGQAGQYSNTTYYYTDSTHLTKAGYGIVEGYISAAVLSL